MLRNFCFESLPFGASTGLIESHVKDSSKSGVSGRLSGDLVEVVVNGGVNDGEFLHRLGHSRISPSLAPVPDS